MSWGEKIPEIPRLSKKKIFDVVPCQQIGDLSYIKVKGRLQSILIQFFSTSFHPIFLKFSTDVPWIITQGLTLRFFQKFSKKFPSCGKIFFNFPSKKLLEGVWNIVKKLQKNFQLNSFPKIFLLSENFLGNFGKIAMSTPA